MPIWREDFSACTLEDVLGLQSENRAWSKEIRWRTSALVNNRLARNISQDDYIVNRKRAYEETAENQRRAVLLTSEIANRNALSRV